LGFGPDATDYFDEHVRQTRCTTFATHDVVGQMLQEQPASVKTCSSVPALGTVKERFSAALLTCGVNAAHQPS